MTVTLSYAALAIFVIFCVPVFAWLKNRLKQSSDREELERQLLKYRHEAEQAHKDRDATMEEVKKQSEELQIIYEVARSLGASTNLSETQKIVVSMIRRMRIPHNTCLLFVAHADGGLDVLSSDADKLPDLSHPLLLRTMKDQRATLMPSVSDPSAQVLPDEPSILLVPLRVRNESVGLIYLGSLRPQTHKPEHLEKMKTLAALAAPSIKTALLFGKQVELLDSERNTRSAVEAKNHQLDGLQKLGAAIGTSLKLEDTLKAVAENLRQLIKGAQSVIFLVADEESLLKVEYAHSPYADYLGRLQLRPDEGLLGRANASNEAVLVSDTRESEGLINKERSAIVAALRAEDKTLGFLYLGAVQENLFGEEQRQLVTTVAYQTSLAANNARLYERTQQMASTDGLTGLYLHRFFQVRLSEEMARADREQKSICLVMVDTDHFKTFNDTLGHPAGDGLLKEIAALLKDKVRPTDIVCRYGGDEFALILKDVPKEEAARTCERIRETFQLRFATAGVQVTASIGLACYPSDASTKAELAQLADEMLYVSKRGGRNRVSVAPTRNAAPVK